MIMMKARTDEVTDLMNCTIMVDGEYDTCIDEMIALLNKITDEKPDFMEAVFDRMIKQRKNRR